MLDYIIKKLIYVYACETKFTKLHKKVSHYLISKGKDEKNIKKFIKEKCYIPV